VHTACAQVGGQGLQQGPLGERVEEALRRRLPLQGHRAGEDVSGCARMRTMYLAHARVGACVHAVGSRARSHACSSRKQGTCSLTALAHLHPPSSDAQRHRGQAAQLGHPQVRPRAADQERQEDRRLRAHGRVPELRGGERESEVKEGGGVGGGWGRCPAAGPEAPQGCAPGFAFAGGAPTLPAKHTLSGAPVAAAAAAEAAASADQTL